MVISSTKSGIILNRANGCSVVKRILASTPTLDHDQSRLIILFTQLYGKSVVRILIYRRLKVSSMCMLLQSGSKTNALRRNPISMEGSTHSNPKTVEEHSKHLEAGPFPRFDLGGEGRQPWYMPNEGTIFPVKKSALPTRDAKPVTSQAVSEELEPHVLWGVTEHEVEWFVQSGREIKSKDTASQLRTRQSIEEEVERIEDEEVRRLTGVAYLS